MVAGSLACFTETMAKAKMETMRTQYSRYLKAKPSGSDGFVTARQSWILQKLKFLEIHMKKRQSKSNIHQNVSLFILHMQLHLPNLLNRLRSSGHI